MSRMPTYLRCLKILQSRGVETVSSVAIAKEVNLNPMQVKKDIAFASKKHGKPKVGFCVDELIRDVEDFLGCHNIKQAVVVGVGKLGKTLLSYNGFSNYGLSIIAGFDNDPEICGTSINDKPIYSLSEINRIVRLNGIKMGIITVPKAAAQEVCNILVNAGIKGIWNFAAAHLNVPAGIALKNEDLAASLSILSQQLTEILES